MTGTAVVTNWKGDGFLLLLSMSVVLALVLVLLSSSLAMGWTFSGGGYEGALHMVEFSADYADATGDWTGRASGTMVGVGSGSGYDLRLGIVADELPPLVTVVNWTTAAPCAQVALNASATFTGGDSGAGLQCWVCLSTSGSTCDGTWATTETWVSTYDGGFNVSCTVQIDGDDFNQTYHGGGLYVWFRATSAIGMVEDGTPSYTDQAPLQIDFYQEEAPSVPWYASNASWVNLAIQCGECGEMYPIADLTGLEVSSYFVLYNSTCGLSQVKLWWTEPGDETFYYRQQVPYNNSLTTLNVFGFNATQSTPLEVPFHVIDYLGAFSDPESTLRIRGYINGTITDIAGTYIGDNTQPSFYLLRPYDYIFRLHNDQYTWDRGPVMITTTDTQTLRVLDVSVTDRVTTIYDKILFEFSTDYTTRRIRLTYNDTVDDTDLVCMDCYNTTSSGAALFSNCLPAGVETGVIDYTPAAQHINETFLCCVNVVHGSFSDNRTYCEPIRLHNASAKIIDLGLVVSDTWHARIAWGVILGSAFIFTSSTAELGAVFIVLEVAFFVYVGWIDLAAPILYVALLLALAAKLGGRTGG